MSTNDDAPTRRETLQPTDVDVLGETALGEPADDDLLDLDPLDDDEELLALTDDSFAAELLGRVAALPELDGPPVITRGTRIAEIYEVVRLLGQGGMGAVYLARDLQLGRQVVIKVVLGRTLQPEQLRLFEREARATARLRHPAVVTIHAYGAWHNLPYMVLEHLEGESLEATLARGPLPELEACRIMLEVARGLGAAHEAGLVHRDLKPANIFLELSGQPRILDFGIVEFDPTHDTLTNSLSDAALLRPGPRMAGTPVYMAPEQVRGQNQGPPTDVWAAGVTLCELVTGKRPVRIVDDTVSRRPLDLDDLRAIARPELVAVVAQCVAKDPAARFADGNALADALAHLIASHGATALDGEPFRFLAAFDERAAGWFFGREPETARAVLHLREHPVLAILGPSGSGKSSLVLAGVVPRMRRTFDWHPLSLRPGKSPLRTLIHTARLAARDLGAHTLLGNDDENALRTMPGLLGVRLRDLCRQAQAGLVLVVDQAEEIFAPDIEDHERQAFVAALLACADDPDTPLRLVLTLREDFLSRLTALPALERAVTRSPICLGRPSRDALARAIREPARRAGCAVEPRLVDALVDAVADEVAPLPVLQVAMSRIWARRTGNMLNRDALEAVGGLRGVLADHAESALDALVDPRDVAAMRTILTELVAPDNHTRQRRTREELDTAVADPDRAGRILEHLARNALVTLHKDEGQLLVDLAHEALITGWDRLDRWLHESDDERAFSLRLAAAAAHWNERRTPTLLWTGDALAEASARLLAAPERLGDVERRFVEASQQLEARGRRRRRVALFAAVLLSLAIAAVSVWGYTVATGARAEAEDASRRAELERQRAVESADAATRAWRTARSRELAAASQSVQTHDPLLALLLARSALSTAPTTDAEAALHDALRASRERARLTHPDPDFIPRDLRATPDRNTLLSIATTQPRRDDPAPPLLEARLWSRTAEPLATLGPWPRDAAPHLHLADDGTVLAADPTGLLRHHLDGRVQQLTTEPVRAVTSRGTTLAFATDRGVFVAPLDTDTAPGLRHTWDRDERPAEVSLELLDQDRLFIVTGRASTRPTQGSEAAEGPGQQARLVDRQGNVLQRFSGAELLLDGARRTVLAVHPNLDGLAALDLTTAEPLADYPFPPPYTPTAVPRILIEPGGSRLIVPAGSERDSGFALVDPRKPSAHARHFAQPGVAPRATFAFGNRALLVPDPARRSIQVLDIDPDSARRELATVRTLELQSIALAPTVATDEDGRWLFVGGAGDEQVEVVAVDGARLGALPVSNFVDQILWLGRRHQADEALVAVRTRQGITLFALEPSELPGLPAPPAARVAAPLLSQTLDALGHTSTRALAWSADGERLLATADTLRSPPVVLSDLTLAPLTAPVTRVLDTTRGELLASHDGLALSNPSPDGTAALMIDSQGTVSLTDPHGRPVARLRDATGTLAPRLEARWNSDLLVLIERSFQSGRVAVFERDGALRYERNTGDDLRDAVLEPIGSSARLLLLFADRAEVVDLSGTPLATLPIDAPHLGQRAFWLDSGPTIQRTGQQMLSWDPTTGQTHAWEAAGSEVVALDHPLPHAPDARLAAWNRTERMLTLHAADGSIVAELAAGAAIRGIATSPHGALAILTADGVWLWRNGEGPVVLRGDTLAVAFHPDGNRIALGLANGHIEQLHLDPHTLTSLAEHRSTRTLTPAEERSFRLGAFEERP